ncbi:heme ABC exporter ATP-binding protein CcmA [Thermaurantiacus sp.]
MTQQPAGARLVADDVVLVRGGRLVLDNLSFTLAPGEALVLTGPNGSGKTSLLRALAGLLEPAAGRIDNPFPTAFHGPDIALKPEARLGRELAFWAALDGRSRDQLLAAARAMGVEDLLDLPVAYLSAGQKTRAALVRLIASGATLWLLDEPTATLDARSSDRLEEAIARHLGAGGLVVAATHRPLLQAARRIRLGGEDREADRPLCGPGEAGT